jgi:hypothetical protein
MLRQLSSGGITCLAMTNANFASPKTIDDMIVDHPGGLHVRVAYRRADELEAALLQVFAQSIGLDAGCGIIFQAS